MIGGADVVYDAVGTRTGLDLALRSARAWGRVCLVGSPGNLGHLDVTAVWSRNVEVRGTLAYGREAAYGGLHTFDLVTRLLQDGPSPPVQRLVTHRFPLSEVRQALATVCGKGVGRPGKVVFTAVQGGTSA
jgi:threonine dehydrogenase-like Zn-dependent dehydrogenase